MRDPVPFKPRLDRLRKGIDNTHIDVHLSPQFKNRATDLVRRMLTHEISVNYWGESPPKPSTRELDAVRDSYIGMMEVVIDDTRRQSKPELIQLLQFSVFKFLIELVGVEMERMRVRMQRQRAMESQTADRAMQLHDRMVMLARESNAIRYEVTRLLLRQMLRIESTALRKLRKSVIGMSWPIPKRILFNPMLHIPSLWMADLFMNHYTLIFADQKEMGQFETWNRLITSAFSEYLPEWMQAAPDAAKSDAGKKEQKELKFDNRVDQGGLTGFLESELLLSRSLQEAEYKSPEFSWLDLPENMERFMFSVDPLRSFRLDSSQGQASKYWPQEQWTDFQRRQMDELMDKVKQAGLISHVLAAYRTPQVYQMLHKQVPARVVFQYLRGSVRKRDMLKRLRAMSLEAPVDEVFNLLNSELTQLKRLGPHERRTNVMRYIKDVLVFRRDLKDAYVTYRCMDQIRVLEKPEDIDLSGANHSLHEFLVREEFGEIKHSITNHVVIKADIRGSTRMTDELRNRNLNPASHFSLNFFGPITKLLDDYGAVKIFVEGDAIILSIYEYEDVSFQWLSVAHACGLASQIIRVIETQNASNRKHGLPELELGLGIVFASGSPTFLYDGEHQITISPAINRADMLSSCSYRMKQSEVHEMRQGKGVEVASPIEKTHVDKPGGDGLLRYNVNGIELDAPAFYKLKSEVSLKRLEANLGKRRGIMRLYAGRYPDRKGKMHWLIVREAPIRELDGASLGAEEKLQRQFYEVVTDPEIIRLIKERLTSRKGRRSSVGKHVGSPSSVDSRYLH